MTLAEVVVNIETLHHPHVTLSSFVHPHQLGHRIAQGVRAMSPRSSAVCPKVRRNTRAPMGCRSAWYVSSRRSGDVPLYHLGEFPAEIHGILDADVESLSAYRGMHVRGIASEEHATLAIGRRPAGPCR